MRVGFFFAWLLPSAIHWWPSYIALLSRLLVHLPVMEATAEVAVAAVCLALASFSWCKLVNMHIPRWGPIECSSNCLCIALVSWLQLISLVELSTTTNSTMLVVLTWSHTEVSHRTNRTVLFCYPLHISHIALYRFLVGPAILDQGLVLSSHGIYQFTPKSWRRICIRLIYITGTIYLDHYYNCHYSPMTLVTHQL
jgi:hypothetical protein